MKRLLKSSSKLLRFLLTGSLIFYAISGINSVLNYALYPVLSRLLPVSDFGEAQFLLSAFNQLSVGFIVLNILAIIIAALITDKKQQDHHIASLNVVASAIAVAITVVGVVALYVLSDGLNLSSGSATAFLGAALLLNVPFTIFVGQLQGNGKFVASAVVSFVATLGKFGFSVLFAAIGLGVGGVIAGIACGMLAAIVLSLFYVKGIRHDALKKPLTTHFKTLSLIKTQALIGLCVIGIITILSTVDSLISRILLSSVEAGRYATVATLSKIILAATAPLLWLALPRAVGRNYRAVWQYIGLTALIGGLCTFVFAIHPAWIIKSALSVDASSYAGLLVLASVSMTIYSVGLIATAVLLCYEKPYSLVRIYTGLIIGLVVLVVASIFLPAVTMREVLLGQIILGLVITVPSLIALGSLSRRP